MSLVPILSMYHHAQTSEPRRGRSVAEQGDSPFLVEHGDKIKSMVRIEDLSNRTSCGSMQTVSHEGLTGRNASALFGLI